MIYGLWRDESFNIAKNPKYDKYEKGVASTFYNFYYKKPSGRGIKNKNMSNKEFVGELSNPIIKINNKKEKYNHLMQIILRMLISLRWN